MFGAVSKTSVYETTPPSHALGVKTSGNPVPKAVSKSASQSALPPVIFEMVHQVPKRIMPVSVGTDPSLALKTRKGTGLSSAAAKPESAWRSPARLQLESIRPWLNPHPAYFR